MIPPIYRQYVPKNFKKEQLEIIQHANTFIESYSKKGILLTLRQLYYLFVSENLLPNVSKSYDRLGNIISQARLAGLVSWTAIEDRNRSLRDYMTYPSPAAAITSIRNRYMIDKWKNQTFRPEVWVEKAALEGVVASICTGLNVPYFACRGYNSQSEQWAAGVRFMGHIQQGQIPIVFHLGDHDPSGIDMTRDNQERLTLFTGVQIQVHRIALNMDQIEEYRLPENPAKTTDARFQNYREKYGEHSWELDALKPTTLQSLIENAILQIRDESAWKAAVKEEQRDIQTFDDILLSL